MTTKDYFIDYQNRKIKAYSLHGFLQGISELYEENYVIHEPYRTSKRIGNIFEVSFVQSDEGKKLAELKKQRTVEKEKENRETELSSLIALLSDENLEIQSKKVFPEFKEFADQFNVTDRGATGLKKKLKQVRDELLKELEGLG